MRSTGEHAAPTPRCLSMSYSDTLSRRHRRVCTEPLHVMEGPEGTVLVFFPDGRSVALTVEAAARSTLLLARAVRSANQRNTDPHGENRRHSATILPFGVSGEARVH